MELSEMNLEQVVERLAALETEVREAQDIESVNAATEEKRGLLERKAELESIETRKRVADGIAKGKIKAEVVEERKDKMENIEVRNTPEYINAFAEYIKSNDDKEVRALLTENTTNGTIPVPELVDEIVRTAWNKEGIMSLVKKSYLKGNLKVGFEISSTGAIIHTEGTDAPAQETLTLGIVTLVPQSIKKWITISDEAMDLRGEAFLQYVYEELAYQIAKKAADTLIAEIKASTTTGSSTSPIVPEVSASSASVGTIASAMAALSDQAQNLAIAMNKATWAEFKNAQYTASYSIDPFEGIPVVFNNTIASFASASTGDTVAIVGDFGYGALANFPNGEEIKFTFDDKSLAEADLVKIVGREYVGLGVVAPYAFAKVVKA